MRNPRLKLQSAAMETSILTPTEKYAAAALFSLALHRSQIDQTRNSDPLGPLEEEPIGDGAGIGRTTSVSDHPQLWIHENSGLLLPIFRYMQVDYQAWKGLKETAGMSTQERHHVGSFLTLLSEERDGITKERKDKELAVRNSVESTERSMGPIDFTPEEIKSIRDYEIKCRDRVSQANDTIGEVVAEAEETALMRTPSMIDADAELNEMKTEALEKTVHEGNTLSEQRKVTVLCEIVASCLVEISEDGSSCSPRSTYDARHRVALRLVASWLHVNWKRMEAIETMVASSILGSLKGTNAEEGETGSSSSPSAKWARGTLIGAAALTGGALMALTGGFAAPVIAHGLGALAPAVGSVVPSVGGGVAAAATATGSIAGSATVAASFGAAGAGIAGTKMANRTAGLDEFEFHRLGKNEDQCVLAVEILVSGIAFEDEDYVRPWEGHSDNLEKYIIKWESKQLIALTCSIQELLAEKLVYGIVTQGAMLSVLAALAAALAVPAALVSASSLIDNHWAVALDRSDQAGRVLAEVLLQGLHGKRPVTLIGFALGARVIFRCLQCLAEKQGINAGIIERVVLLGAPVSVKDENWITVRKMVAGRFVNGYSENDWTLGIVYRSSSLSQSLAGIQPVDVPGIENVDLTEDIKAHASYLWMSKKILRRLDLESYYAVLRPSEPLKEKLELT